MKSKFNEYLEMIKLDKRGILIKKSDAKRVWDNHPKNLKKELSLPDEYDLNFEKFVDWLKKEFNIIVDDDDE